MKNVFEPEIYIQVNQAEGQEDQLQEKKTFQDKVEERKKRRVVKASHYLFNQQVLKKKPPKNQNNQEEEDGEKDQTAQKEVNIRQLQYFSQNELDIYEENKKKKKKKKWMNPLQVFKQHQPPKINNLENAPERLDQRNIYELKFPKITNVHSKDVRLEKQIDPYLRQIIFDHNQVKKSMSTPKFDAQMLEYKQQFALYKQGLDELDEINRLTALNKYGAYSDQMHISPQFNLKLVKFYPPQLQAENMIKNYIPQSQIYNSSYVNLHDYFDKQKKPRLLAPIPLTFKNVFNV